MQYAIFRSMASTMIWLSREPHKLQGYTVWPLKSVKICTLTRWEWLNRMEFCAFGPLKPTIMIHPILNLWDLNPSKWWNGLSDLFHFPDFPTSQFSSRRKLFRPFRSWIWTRLPTADRCRVMRWSFYVPCLCDHGCWPCPTWLQNYPSRN